MKHRALTASLLCLVLASSTALATTTPDKKPKANTPPPAATSHKPSWTPSATGRENARRALKGPPGWQADMEEFKARPKRCFSPTGTCPDKKDRDEGAGAKPLVQPPASTAGKKSN